MIVSARAVTLLAIVVTRAAIAATLAHAVLPLPRFVAAAAALDALIGAAIGLRTVRRREASGGLAVLELSLRAGLLWVATLAVFGDRYLDLFSGHAWPGSSVGTILVWFAPVFVGRLAIVLLADVWRAPQLHPDERTRRATLAAGVTLLVMAVCIAGLLRSHIMAAFGAIAIVLIAPALRDGARRRRWLAAVRAGEVPSHRLASELSVEAPTLDEAPDSVLIATAGPNAFRSAEGIVARVRARGGAWWRDMFRIAVFAIAAVTVTAGFDGACWHGSGWIPVRHERGDFVLRPEYSRSLNIVEWTIPYDISPQHLVWRIADGRFETDEERFVRWMEHGFPLPLAHAVPPSTCAAGAAPIERKHARSLDERARIVEPTRIAGRLLYTVRQADGHLARVEIARDGTSSTCTADPPATFDEQPARLLGADMIALDGSRSCAVLEHELVCWGATSGVGDAGGALPKRIADGATRVAAGQTATCWYNGGLYCWSQGPGPGFFGRHTVFAAGGSSFAWVDDARALHVAPPTARMVPPPDLQVGTEIRRLALATEQGCALRSDRTLRCFGPAAPHLDNEKGVMDVALGASLACVLRTDNTVWCAHGDALPTKVEGLAGVSALDVGDGHACAITHSEVWCWGNNGSGQLGDGTKIDRATPVRVLAGAKFIATGAAHSCAIDAETGVRCWGSNTAGQLGDGTFVDRHTPVEVIR